MSDENFLEELTNPTSRPSGGIWDDTQDPPVKLLQYDTDSVEFARGVQVGMIWQLLHGGINEFEIPVYSVNAEMVMRMAEASGFSAHAYYEEEEVEGEDHEWMMVVFKNLTPVVE